MYRVGLVSILAALFLSCICTAQIRDAQAIFNEADSLAHKRDERALVLYTQSADLAQKEKNYDVHYKSLYRKGIFYDITGEGDSALLYFQQATDVAISHKKWVDVAKAKNSLGVVEFRAGNYTASLQHYFDALKGAEKAKDSSLTFKITNNIGHVYFYIDLKRAKPYYEKNLTLARQMRDSDAVADCFLNIANVYNNLEKHDSSYFYYNKALQQNLDEEDAYTRANILQNMAISEKNLNRLNEAQIHLNESMLIFQAEGDLEGLAQSYVNLGDVAILKNDWSKERRYFIKALTLSKELNSKEGLKYSYEGLISVESKTGNYQKAFEYSRKLSDVKDSLLNNEIATAVTKMEAVYQNEKKQLLIENLNKEAKLQKEQIDLKNSEIKFQNFLKISFAIAFILVLLIAGIILFAYLQKQRANRSLNEKNTVIERSLEEKELLMKEIHHRAKNNLQVVSGLLSMQSLRISDEKSKDAMTEATNRVKSMALIHEQLYQPGAQTDVDVSTYMNELSNGLFNSYNLSDKNVKLLKEIEAMKLDVDLMIPIGIMTNEIMSNALKHAFKNTDHGILSLKIWRDANEIFLQIKDNGPGVPVDFNYETARSFGMRLVHSLSKKINAKIQYKNENGTWVEIVIPAKIY